jgi:thiosulfate/3-mercaptopyruvate sulfurtransferase
VDARTAAEYSGTTAANAEIPRPGHIPGAANVYWMQGQASKDDMSLLPEASLRKLYESAGVTPDRPVVTYCNTGMQASQSYFTLKYLGYDTHMYDGSFSQWSNVKDAAVQK